jgi:hypothetical protein
MTLEEFKANAIADAKHVLGTAQSTGSTISADEFAEMFYAFFTERFNQRMDPSDGYDYFSQFSQNGAWHYAREFAKGYTKGYIKGKREVVCSMLAKELAPQLIAELTGIGLVEIEQLETPVDLIAKHRISLATSAFAA